MARDFIDHQNHVRERVRTIEINPGPNLEYVPAGWDPAYDPLDEITLVAYAMLPFTAYQPSDLPAIPAAAQYLADRLSAEGFDHSYQARAYMRAAIMCGGHQLPSSLKPPLLQRLEGSFSDSTGAAWRTQPNGRAVHWAFMDSSATPPETGEIEYEWRRGIPALFYDGIRGYWASTNGNSVQTISNGNASYTSGDTVLPCLANQYENLGWQPAGTGIHDRSGPTNEPFCFPAAGATTELGNWLMAAYDLDPFAGLYWPTPPTYYTGQPFHEFTRSADGDLFTFPGFTEWRDQVAEWCFTTPDWLTWMLPWYRAHRPRLSQPGTSSHHWQRAPLRMPWRGTLEYRVWQRVLYLRGTVWNPYRWGTQIPLMPLPPGVEPYNQNVVAGARVAGVTDSGDRVPPRYRLQAPVLPSPANDYTWNLYVVTTVGVGEDIFDVFDLSPPYLSLDNVAFAIQHNPPYVP